MLHRKKENNTVWSSINWPSNLVNNVFASVNYLGFYIKLLFFFTYNLKSFPDFVSKSSEHYWGDFFYWVVRTNPRRSDFDDSNLFQS